MKTFSLITLLLFSVSSFAQDNNYQKKFNISVNPLGLAIGIGNIGLDYAITDQVTLGGNLSYANLDTGDIEASANGFGLKAQVFANGAFTNSWYASVFYSAASGDAEDTFDGDTASIDISSMGLTGGYMWIWENFNIQFGGGFQSISVDASSNTGVDIDDIEGTGLALDFTLGWAF